ncbi:hypothetical protein, partial [Streptomyces alboviridis]|uniref:hypothetical protein n=1 Tax=Streptomyces alboviridis TaxID=67269 RepID=UPI001F293174
YRARTQNPHRLAYWMPHTSVAPLVVMTISLSVGTAQQEWEGAANLSIEFRPCPVEIGEA